MPAPSPMRRHLRGLGGMLHRFVTRLTCEEGHLATQQLFKNLFFSWLFLHTVLLLPFHREVWSPEALILRRDFDPLSSYDWLFYLSGHPYLRPCYLVFVAAQLASLAAGIAGIAPRLLNVLVCFTTLNLNNLTPVILDGGNNLSQLILVYMLLLNTSGEPSGSVSATWRMTTVALSNAALFVCRLQVAAVYVCTAFFKLNGPLWQSGMALYYIFQADSYTHPILYRLVLDHPWVSLVGSYFTVGVQALLPTLVWFRRTRPYILTAAALTHLGISFGMGLFTFGLVMCVMYTLFLSNELSLEIIRAFSPTEPLRVFVSSSARGQKALAWARRLDWLGALVLTSKTDVDGPPLVVVDSAGREWEGPVAVCRVAAKLPVCLPVLPVLAALTYCGLANFTVRYLTPAPGRRGYTEALPGLPSSGRGTSE